MNNKRIDIFFCSYYVLQHRLKSSQREKVRQFITFTETNEKTAINCLSQNDWRLDVASDLYFQNPEKYYIDTKPLIDKKKLTHLFDRYKGRRRDLYEMNFLSVVHVFVLTRVLTGLRIIQCFIDDRNALFHFFRKII